MRLVFYITLALSASLLFVIQPLVAKSLLPLYGGTPAVWTICILFFQSVLLMGYSYAWLLVKWPKWPMVHYVLLVLSFFIVPSGFIYKYHIHIPEAEIFINIASQLGIPLILLASTAPLLQFIYSKSQYPDADDPYYLYAVSNLGSLLVILLYPFLIERLLGIYWQFYVWKIFFIIYLLLVLFIVGFGSKLIMPVGEKTSKNVSWKMIARWIFYSFIPCSLMLGVSFYLSTDIAATPLLWMLPLALYLISYIITFAKKPLIPQAIVSQYSLIFYIFPLGAFLTAPNELNVIALLFFHLLPLFVFSLLANGQLIKSRPAVDELPLFYFCIALGGVIAGIFNGLVAPKIFSGPYEYPLILVASVFCLDLSKGYRLNALPILLLIYLSSVYFFPSLMSQSWLGTHHVVIKIFLFLLLFFPKNKLNLGVGLLLVLFYAFFMQQGNQVIVKKRNFYGMKTVSSIKNMHVLMSQNTLHGFQIVAPKPLFNLLGYYTAPHGVIPYLREFAPHLKVTILGVGVGMEACHFRQQDNLTFIDIDEQVISIAQNAKLFKYVSSCPPRAMIHGDGRLVLQQQQPKQDLIIVDVFSSDAIPTHLITLEAFKLYQQHLQPFGLLLIHISNRHLDLKPVIIAHAHQLGLALLQKKTPDNTANGELASEWVALTSNMKLAQQLIQKEGWQFLTAQKLYLWTDDYSNLVPLLRWWQ